jgi:hypothetical protein
LLNLSTVADAQISNPPWVKFQSAGWVNFPSAPTAQVNSSTLQLSLTPPIYRFDKSAQATTSLTPGGGMAMGLSFFSNFPLRFRRASAAPGGFQPL